MPSPRRLVAFAAALALVSGAALADDKPGDGSAAGRLKELEQALAKSKAARDQDAAHAVEIAHEADALREEMVASAAAAQEHEEALSNLELQVHDLDRKETAERQALDLKRQQMNGLLTALTRLAFRPSEALIGQPTSPAETVRSAILLRDVIPNIDHQAAALKADIAAVAQLRAAIAAQKTKIADAAKKLDADHARLAALYTKKAEVQHAAESRRHESEQQLAALASEAQDLRDLLARIEEGKKLQQQKEQKEAAAARPAEPSAQRSFSQAQGEMPMPARGTVAVHFGQPGESGMPARGITIETRPDAQVVAPFDGQVAFAGPFRGYGLLLIIEHGEGYHTLLAGMARIDTSVGQHLVAGEPVGVMGDSEEKPLLYVELRHQGQPVNPLPWLASRKSKVSG